MTHVESPDFLARVSFEGHDVVGTGQIHDPVDDQGREFGTTAQVARRRIAAQRVGPCLAQAADVLGVDLRQRRVARPG